MAGKIVTGFVAPKPAAAYADEIKELAEAGDGAAYVLTIEGVTKDGVTEYPTTELAKFQSAAREAGYSAKVVHTEVNEKTKTAERYLVLGPRRTHVRGEKDATVTDAAS